MQRAGGRNTLTTQADVERELNSMKMKKIITYQAPEGIFNGTINDARIIEKCKDGKLIENLRLTVTLDPLAEDYHHEFRVRVDYWENQSEPLRGDFVSILGAEVEDLVDGNDDLIPEKLNILHGKRVQVEITHEQRPGHNVAFRKARIMRQAA